MERLGKILGHLRKEALTKQNADISQKLSAATIAKDDSRDIDDEYTDTDGGRNAPTHWNGWGYADTEFVVDNDTFTLTLSGGRFAETVGPEGSRMTMNDFIRFAEDELGVDRNLLLRSPPSPPGETTLPKPITPVSRSFLDDISGIAFTDRAVSRMRRSHGHTCQEVYALRVTPHLVGRPECTWFPRLVDGVALPSTVNQVKILIAAAQKHNVCLVPRGGGTSVTRALNIDPAKNERRSVVCVDMRRIRRVVWIDRDNHMAKVEAGLTGVELERRLNRLGLTMGHEPDSMDFSTMGGWIATKASGMKRARYGNIEDIVITVNMETCAGTLGTLAGPFERASSGPDVVKSLAIGSEGTLGIVTDCVVKLRPVPTHLKYGSMLFKDFDSGVAALRELARKNLLPASARLLDNAQFKMGQALKPVSKHESASKATGWKEKAKAFYIETWNGFDVDTLAAATFVYEGYSASQVTAQESAVIAECKRHGGAIGDAASGKRGYFLTFMIAYLRDFGLGLNFLSESFEASVPWTKVSLLTKAVEAKLKEVAKAGGVEEQPLVGVRISQAYDTCCCCYFYFGIVADDAERKMTVFTRMEHEARDVIVKMGGSLSHHHGVGKAKKEWYSKTQTDLAHDLMHSTIKNVLDPKNVFGVGNLGF